MDVSNGYTFSQKVVNILTEAVNKDKNGEYNAALTLYAQGLDYLIALAKFEKNPTFRAATQTKITKFLDRVETISKIILPHDRMVKFKLLKKKLKKFVMRKPNVKWEDIVGLERIKAFLKDVVWIATNQQKSIQSILIYGPPGFVFSHNFFFLSSTNSNPWTLLFFLML